MEEKPQADLQVGTARRRLSSAADVIDALGGTKAVAELLGVGQSSVSNYRKQGFPARSHFILSKLCAERGLDVADAVFGGYRSAPAAKPAYRPVTEAPESGLKALIEAGFERVTLPILQPAAPFIDRMGPEMQRRLYTFTDPAGDQLCLRPDLTIPTALKYIADGRQGAARYCYQGTAFRYQPRGSGQPEEFTQLGLEIIGGADEVKDATDVFERILGALLSAGLPREKCQIIISDAQHYNRRIDEYGFSDPVAQMLKRSFNQGDANRATEAYEALQSEARIVVAPHLNPPADSANIAGRSGAEIRQRQETKKRRAQIAQSDLDKIGQFLTQERGRAEENNFIHGAPSKVEQAFFERAQAAGLNDETVFLRPAPAQKMAYYTGIFFEIRIAGMDRPIATGGRYDDLLHSLGAEKPVAAVGGAIALERLARAVEAQNGR